MESGSKFQCVEAYNFLPYYACSFHQPIKKSYLLLPAGPLERCHSKEHVALEQLGTVISFDNSWRHNMAPFRNSVSFQRTSRLFVYFLIVVVCSTHSSTRWPREKDELHVCIKWRASVVNCASFCLTIWRDGSRMTV